MVVVPGVQLLSVAGDKLPNAMSMSLYNGPPNGLTGNRAQRREGACV